MLNDQTLIILPQHTLFRSFQASFFMFWLFCVGIHFAFVLFTYSHCLDGRYAD